MLPWKTSCGNEKFTPILYVWLFTICILFLIFSRNPAELFWAIAKCKNGEKVLWKW
jgi:hypothetical protein